MRRILVLFGATVAIFVLSASYADAGEDPATHPNPLPLSAIRPEHPRLWFNSDNVNLLRQRWTDPSYADIVAKYEGKADPVSLALEGLATHNTAKCSKAAETVSYEYRPTGDAEAGYVDSISLVFDWCYDYLDAGKRASLVSKIEALRDEHRNNPSKGIGNFFRWHETFSANSFAYLASVLAIEGEPGVRSELREAQNVLQNLQELGDEVRGDGGYRGYFYQGSIQTLPFVMWSYATDMDFPARSRFTQNLAEWAVYRLSPTGRGFTRGPGDDAAFELGFMTHELAAGGFYLLASHFNDPVSQWLGNYLKNEFGQSRHWQFQGPSFISLVYYDPGKTARSPAQAGMPLTALFEKIGMVHTRSSWGTGSDVIHAWFYNGPAVDHSNASQNHFTIWRGDDPLIMKGGNYLGSPSTYKSHYGEPTISSNSLLFSPVGSNTPDHSGGQNLGWSNVEQRRQKYPVAERVGSWSGQHLYRGEIIHYEDTSQYTIASGDATLAYNPDNVNSYIRDYVYIKPDIFLIRDRFNTTDVATVRSLIHSRTKPIYDDIPTVIQGSTSAGIIESTGEHFRLQNGGSEADIQVLWPANPKLRFVGGAGYESYADGYNSDPYTDCQDWLRTNSQLPRRAALIEGQWRTEIVVTPPQANGNLIQAIYVSGTNPATRPQYSMRQVGSDLIVTVTRGQTTLDVKFPPNRSPTVTLGPSAPTPTPTPVVPTATPVPQEPFNGPHNIPGRIEVEDFDIGGPGVAYSDTSPANNGGAAYRYGEEVDIKTISGVSDNGHAVGWNEPGEWLEYTINVTATGDYTFGFRLLSNGSSGQIHAEIDGTDVTGPIAAPLTGDWNTDNWTTVNITGIFLTAGEHILRIVTDAGWYDHNLIDVTAASIAPTPTPPPTQTPGGPTATPTRTSTPTPTPTPTPTGGGGSTPPTSSGIVTVPVVANINGVEGTPWRSDVAVANRNSITQRLRFIYQSDAGNKLSRIRSLKPFSTVLFKNIVKNFLGGGDGKGPLQIEVLTNGTEPPSVISRTYAARSFGNLGSGLPADVEPATGMFVMPGLVRGAKYRSSVAVMAGPGGDVSAVFQLYRGSNGAVSGYERRTIAAGNLEQWAVDKMFPGLMRAGEPMTVKVILSQPGIAFASLVDNNSTDSAVFLGKQTATSWIVPVVAHLPGKDDTLWKSSVTAWNGGSTAAEISLEYLPEDTDNLSGGIDAAPFMLGGYDTVALDDVLRTHFGITNGKGALVVKATKPIAVTSRVWTTGPEGGTSGNGVRTVPGSTLANGKALLPGVRMRDGFRTSVGVVTGDAWATMKFKLRDADGILLGQEFVEVPPRTLTQLSLNKLFGNKVTKPDPVGSLVVTSGTEFVAYLTVIDGTSQDPLFVMSR